MKFSRRKVAAGGWALRPLATYICPWLGLFHRALLPVLHYRLLLAAALLPAACSSPDHSAELRAPARAPAAPPTASVPDTVAGYAFLRPRIRFSADDGSDVRGIDDWFFSRFPYRLSANIADKLLPVGKPPKNTIILGGFQKTPAAVLQEFRQQILHLDPARQRRLTWDPARLGRFVFIDSAGATLRPALAEQVRDVSPAQRQEIRQAIGGWNRSPVADRFYSYASLPLFSADGRYVLIVRGQTQQSIGWDSVFIYERTATGWKMLESSPISTI